MSVRSTCLILRRRGWLPKYCFWKQFWNEVYVRSMAYSLILNHVKRGGDEIWVDFSDW